MKTIHIRLVALVILAAAAIGCGDGPGVGPTPVVETAAQRDARTGALVTSLGLSTYAVDPRHPEGDKIVRVETRAVGAAGLGDQPVSLSLSGPGRLNRTEVRTDAGGVAEVFLLEQTDAVTVTAQHHHASPVAIIIPVTGPTIRTPAQ